MVSFGPKLIQSIAFSVLVLFSLSLRAEIKHFGVSDVTRFTSCAENVLHKRVILDSNLPFKDLVPLCGKQTHDELVDVLKQHQIAVREDGNWAYLLHASYFGPWASYTPESEKLKWKHFQVEISAHSADTQYHQNEVELNAAQLSKLKEQVLEQGRLIPIFPPRTQSADEVAKIAFDLLVFIRHTRKDAPPSVVVLLRQADDFAVDGRIIYGEQGPDGGVKLLWDSPVVVSRFAEVSFMDVNGDGAEEIVLKAAYPAGMRDLAAMTIFDVQGQELTRQPQCSVPDLYGYSPDDGTCPIVAESVDIDYSQGPPLQIDANNMLVNGKNAVFKLVGNHYVHPAAAQRTRKPAGPPK